MRGFGGSSQDLLDKLKDLYNSVKGLFKDDKDKTKKETTSPNTNYLYEKINDVDVYPNSCKYFSVINSFLQYGLTPTVQTNNLAQYVTDKIEANNYNILYADVVNDVFGFTPVAHEIPTGLTESQLAALVGNNPAILSYDQNDFWKAETLSGEHGISYQGGTYRDSHREKSGTFDDVKGWGTQNPTQAKDYLGGYYFTW